MPGPTSGIRAQVTGQPEIYFTLDGKYHHVPNWDTYVRLFSGGGSVYQETSIASEYIGSPLAADADVLKGDASPEVYFYNQGKKRHIENWSFLARAFNAQFRIVPQAVMNQVPLAPEGPISDT